MFITSYKEDFNSRNLFRKLRAESFEGVYLKSYSLMRHTNTTPYTEKEGVQWWWSGHSKARAQQEEFNTFFRGGTQGMLGYRDTIVK